VKLVLTALVIATPISWYLMDVWLQNFAYRVSVPWWAFIFVGMLTVVVALIAVIFPTMRTAFANPAKVMKAE
jgi:putative ABC transport system permease protein